MSSMPPVRPYARTPFYFLLVLLAGLWGFYPSYLSRLQETNLSHHAHGLTAFAWMLMLISQATLVRLHKRALHAASAAWPMGSRRCSSPPDCG